jgi:hypothetical protein
LSARRWLGVMAVAGLAIFALSFVNAWIVHDREVRGEGYRFVQYYLSAWRGVGMPVLTLGVLTALGVGIGAVLSVIGRVRVPPWLLLVGSSVALGLIVSAAWPVSRAGHASSVQLSVGLLLPIGIGLATLMVVAGVALTQPSISVAVAAVAIGLLALGGGAGGRWLGLQAAEGTGRHWSEGSYTRAATGGEPSETLTISGETVSIGERWGGSWEWSGWTVVIDNDPACPDSRGAYHAHGVGDADLRFVKVVDTCEDGARAADLETGTWERVP